MAKIREFDAGEIGFKPTETGVEATAATARRVGAFFNQQAGATETLARETERLGRETAKLGSDTQQLGRETGQLGDFKGHLMADTGRRFGSAVEVAGDQAVKYLDHQQISQGAPAFSNLMMRKTDEWNNTVKNADPNDPSIAQRFMENSVEPALEKFKSEGFYTEKGQQWAEGHVDALRKHFAEKTAGDMSTLAGHAAVTNQKQTINSLSNTVRGDPSSMDFALAAMESGTEGVLASSPNLKGPDAARIRSEILQQGKESIIKSAALGHIEKTGAVPDWVSDPKYSPYINGAELKQLAQAAKYYQRLNASEERSARATQEHELKLDFNKGANELELSLTPKNAGDPVTIPDGAWDKLRELGRHPGAALEPGRIASLVNKLDTVTERLNKPEPLARISHDATIDLLKQLRATDSSRLTSNDAIYRAYAEGKLSRADFKFLNDEFSQARTPQGEALSKDRGEFFKKYAPTVDGAMDYGGHSALGSQRMYAFEMEARRQEEDLRKQGKDPHSLYDPANPNFLGNQVSKYRTTLTESMQYNKTISEQKKGGPSSNITGPGKDVLGVEVIDIPKGMSAAEAMEKYKSKSGSQIRLPDGRIGTVP